MPFDNRRIAGPEETQPVVFGGEKCSYKPLISSEGLRNDGRKVDELRPMFLRSGVVSRARGSAYIEMQKTKVTCATTLLMQDHTLGSGEYQHLAWAIDRHQDLRLIFSKCMLCMRYGPRESQRHQEFSDKGKLTCEFKFAPFSCWQRRQHIQDSEEKEFSSFVVQALQPAVCLEKFPKAQVDIYVTVLENDGNALSAGIICASLALGEAGIEMYDLVSSCSLVQRGNTSLMDPTFQESSSSQVNGKVTVAFLPTMNVVSGLLQDGELTHDQSVKAVKCCMEGCARTYPVLQDALVHTVKRTLKSKQRS